MFLIDRTHSLLILQTRASITWYKLHRTDRSDFHHYSLLYILIVLVLFHNWTNIFWFFYVFFFYRHFVIRPDKWQKVNRVMFAYIVYVYYIILYAYGRPVKTHTYLFMRRIFSHGSHNNSTGQEVFLIPHISFQKTKKKNTTTPFLNSSRFLWQVLGQVI